MAQLSPDLNVDLSCCSGLRNSPEVPLRSCIVWELGLRLGCLVHWDRPHQKFELAVYLAAILAGAPLTLTALAWKQHFDMTLCFAASLMVVLVLIRLVYAWCQTRQGRWSLVEDVGRCWYRPVHCQGRFGGRVESRCPKLW